ncbi:MAG: site-specific integrase [Pseudomonadota bacterium]
MFNAIATARAEIDPTASLKGSLTSPVAIPRATLTKMEDFAKLVRAIWTYDGGPTTRAGLQLLALLYPRPGELRQARWAEFNLGEALWVIPKERTKMRREHCKPLSSPAVTILTELGSLTGFSQFVFPAIHSPERSISENTLNLSLRRIGFTKDEATAHGFRASVSSLLNESGKWSPDAIEAELGHVSADGVRRAYHRADYWDQRVQMTNWWADMLHELQSGTTQ